MQILKMDAIRLDGGTQFRKSINQDVVKDYKEKILDDVVLPPIQVTFDGSDYWLWDGFHRYFAIKAIGLTTIESKVTTGSVQDAKKLARKANSHHGLARDYDTKRNAVLDALDDPDNEGLSSREIAKQCDVSHTFVLNVKKPEKKLGNVSKKKEEVETIPTPPLTQDFAPTEEELNANQIAFEADVQAMNKLLESDDALATAHAEIKRLNADYAMLESRFNALMREKDKAVSLLEKAQRELDKVKRAKK